MKKTTLLTLSLAAVAGILAGCAAPHALTSGSFTYWATPVSSPGEQTTCGCSYAGYVSYAPTNTWGWAPDTNDTTVFTAADGGGRTNDFVYYGGKSLDKNCAKTSVTVPNPPPSAQYRFCIYFPTSVPTTNYPIVLTGFLQ